MVYNFLVTLPIMKEVRVFLVIVASLFYLFPKAVQAYPSPELVISQFKITTNDGQFFMLYNNTDLSIDMSTVQLVYYNHYNLSSATSSKIIPLSGSLPARGYYLVNDGPLTLCYRMVVNSLSLGLSSTAGSVQIAKLTQTSAGAPVTSVIEDSTSWSKTAVAGVNQLPATPQFLLRNPVDSSNNPLVTETGSGTWKAVTVSAIDPCLLTSSVVSAPPPIISASLLLLSSTPPPVSIISTAIGASTSGPTLPAADIGLMAPVVNEVFPNPGSHLTDANDEFVELYNPNDKPFDLTGFQIEAGLTTKYTWNFPDGTILIGKSFTAFSSAQTSVSLNNSNGQVRLLDPFGNVISLSEEYDTAKEDQTWSFANNEWYWTTTPTPGNANVITAGGGTTSAKKVSTTGASAAVKAASSPSARPAAEPLASANPEVAQLHPSALASVAVLAVGYGAYEYKQDITNRLRKLRANRAARRAVGGKP